MKFVVVVKITSTKEVNPHLTIGGREVRLVINAGFPGVPREKDYVSVNLVRLKVSSVIWYKDCVVLNTWLEENVIDGLEWGVEHDSAVYMLKDCGFEVFYDSGIIDEEVK